MITFHVSGTPAPQGSKRHVGGGRMIESSKKVKPWREAVARVASAHLLDEPLDGHLRVIIRFELLAPQKSRFGNRPAGPPDIDKLVRSTLDGLTTSRLIVDDARIVALTATKHWAIDTPGATISVERLPQSHGYP